MPNWSQIAARVNAAQLRTFGESITYVAGTDLFTITAIRLARDPQDNEALAAYEAIWTRAGQFQGMPQPGDTVEMGGVSYLVHSVKPDADPSSDGVKIYLSRQASAPIL